MMMFRTPEFVRARRGFSLTEVIVALLISTMLMAAVIFVFNRVNRGFSRQSLVADVQSVGSIGFFLIGRDLRSAGSNPAGALGVSAGAPLPFGVAEAQRIQIYTDINGDGDVTDVDEDITYSYVDNDPAISGRDTIQRTALGGAVTFITNVRDFQLYYKMSNGTLTQTPPLASDIRMVKIRLNIAADKIDPTSGKTITRDYETLIGLRNFQ